MKKFYFLLMMICSVFAFAACSDKDDTPGGGDGCPVTDYAVKTPTLEPGDSLIITGKGFTQDSKIFLKDDAAKLTGLTVLTVTAADIQCLLPATGTGKYTVILRQEGKDWEMGKLTILVLNPIKDYSYNKEIAAGKVLAITGKGFGECTLLIRPDEEGDDITLTDLKKTDDGVTAMVPEGSALGTYTLIVKQEGAEQELGILKIVPAVRRLTRIESYEAKQASVEQGGGIAYELTSTMTLKYDETGKIIQNGDTKLDYSQAGKLVVPADKEGYSDEVFTLDDKGRAIESPGSTDGDIWHWTYDNDGYLTSGNILMFGFMEQPLKFGYTAGELNYIDDTVEEEGDGGIFFGKLTFGYGEKTIANNIDGVDLFWIIGWSIGMPDFAMRLYGIAGTAPTHLPTKATTSDGMTDYTISYELNGKYVTKITITDNTSTNVEGFPPYYVLTWE